MIDEKALKYSESHEWVHLDGDVATIGVSRFAVDQLTDLILIDLARAGVGATIEAGKPFGEIESVKAVADLYAPVTGEVIEVNQALAQNVQLLAEDPYEKGWLLKVRVPEPGDALSDLMDYNAYQAKIAESPH
jgi:glycine cleavage system H protein